MQEELIRKRTMLEYCTKCNTKEKELRGVTYRGKPSGLYCEICFASGPALDGFLRWENALSPYEYSKKF